MQLFGEGESLIEISLFCFSRLKGSSCLGFFHGGVRGADRAAYAADRSLNGTLCNGRIHIVGLLAKIEFGSPILDGGKIQTGRDDQYR